MLKELRWLLRLCLMFRLKHKLKEAIEVAEQQHLSIFNYQQVKITLTQQHITQTRDLFRHQICKYLKGLECRSLPRTPANGNLPTVRKKLSLL